MLATYREDAVGVDFWVKMPRDMRLLPVQISQRGVRFFRKHKKPSVTALREFIKSSEERIAKKKRWCKRDGVVFVLVRDCGGRRTTPDVAKSDVRALRHAVVRMR